MDRIQYRSGARQSAWVWCRIGPFTFSHQPLVAIPTSNSGHTPDPFLQLYAYSSHFNICLHRKPACKNAMQVFSYLALLCSPEDLWQPILSKVAPMAASMRVPSLNSSPGLRASVVILFNEIHPQNLFSVARITIWFFLRIFWGPNQN